ncbi:MAG: winged helix-turn-helix transcriptional regulator [Alphaproteobacteria bacterium]|nr:winged helix-turn-helix transcriptional regulator [Alphaproteobacteria bacterium]
MPVARRFRPASQLVLERFVPYRLSVLTNRISGALAAHYRRRFGLSIPEWRVMATLARFPGLSAAAVAERTAMDKVTVSRAIAGLKRAGRLGRATDGRDRRRAVLTLSPAGCSVYSRIAPFALERECRLLASLTPAERRALDRLLTKLDRAAASLAEF